jgi:hypothetical protein
VNQPGEIIAIARVSRPVDHPGNRLTP